MRAPLLASLLSASLLLTACPSGGETLEDHTDAGYAALGAGDPAGAVRSFEKALGVIEPGHALYPRAEAGWIDAQIELNPGKAANHVVNRILDGTIEPEKIATYGRKLLNASKYEEAGTVVGEGLKRFPDSELLAELQATIVQATEDAGADEAMEALKGLGYVDQ